ncbi:MAG: hypothetical protein M1829_004603 [Trizodia sp. TS-e1964]|nr:MAG: hypothetical protein M1829_004603 [Trizodia sp. TS-e1964]
MRLAHLHFPLPRAYLSATALQSRLVDHLLAWKQTPQPPPPPPAILTFSHIHPAYTSGRRQQPALSAAEQSYLCARLPATYHPALRGGELTFHGPGQLLAYLVLDLRAHALTPRGYVGVLESALIATCGRYGIDAFSNEHPGVWTGVGKIASVGVHLRRFVSGHGIALNVNTDLSWFERITACGLEGMETTSFEREGVQGVAVDAVAAVFVDEIAKRLQGVEGVDQISEEDINTPRDVPKLVN